MSELRRILNRMKNKENSTDGHGITVKRLKYAFETTGYKFLNINESLEQCNFTD